MRERKMKEGRKEGSGWKDGNILKIKYEEFVDDSDPNRNESSRALIRRPVRAETLTEKRTKTNKSTSFL